MYIHDIIPLDALSTLFESFLDCIEINTIALLDATSNIGTYGYGIMCYNIRVGRNTQTMPLQLLPIPNTTNSKYYQWKSLTVVALSVCSHHTLPYAQACKGAVKLRQLRAVEAASCDSSCKQAVT